MNAYLEMGTKADPDFITNSLDQVAGVASVISEGADACTEVRHAAWLIRDVLWRVNANFQLFHQEYSQKIKKLEAELKEAHMTEEQKAIRDKIENMDCFKSEDNRECH